MAFDGDAAAPTRRDDDAVCPGQGRAARRRRPRVCLNITQLRRESAASRSTLPACPPLAGARPHGRRFRLRHPAGPTASWAAAPTPGVDRSPPRRGCRASRPRTLTWPDGAIRNTWLRVTLKATPTRACARRDVFAIGNLAGETGDPALPRSASAPSTWRRWSGIRTPTRPTLGLAGSTPTRGLPRCAGPRGRSSKPESDTGRSRVRPGCTRPVVALLLRPGRQPFRRWLRHPAGVGRAAGGAAWVMAGLGGRRERCRRPGGEIPRQDRRGRHRFWRD